MIIKLLILLLAALGLIFVVAPFFNYGAFDFQCQQIHCPEQMCSSKTIFSSNEADICDPQPESGCFQDCRIRGYKCGFNESFKENCLKCIESCKSYKEGANLEECFSECYKK